MSFFLLLKGGVPCCPSFVVVVFFCLPTCLGCAELMHVGGACVERLDV